MPKRRQTIIIIITSVLAFILLHNVILIALANITSIFRENNLNKLEVESYKQKIEYLEKEILEYQNAHNNLSIYKGSSFILAKIALRNIYQFYDTITITTETRVNPSSPVINEDGLVGFISETDGNNSKVLLLTNNNKLSVKVCNSYGLLNKYIKKENIFLLSNINNYQDISNDCLVTTSGLQEVQNNLKIGKVIKVETKGIEKLVYVKPFVNFDKLNYLYVIEK